MLVSLKGIYVLACIYLPPLPSHPHFGHFSPFPATPSPSYSFYYLMRTICHSGLALLEVDTHAYGQGSFVDTVLPMWWARHLFINPFSNVCIGTPNWEKVKGKRRYGTPENVLRKANKSMLTTNTTFIQQLKNKFLRSFLDFTTGCYRRTFRFTTRTRYCIFTQHNEER